MRRLALLLAATTLLAVAPVTLAAPSPSPGGVSVVPDPASQHQNADRNSFRVSGLRPGQGFTDAVFVANSTKDAVTVALYPADGIKAQGGGYGYSNRQDPVRDVGAWLRLSRTQVTVPAGQRVKVGVRLVVPAGVTNGQHVGAVVSEPVDQPVTGPVTSVTRYAMPVVVNVIGGRPAPASSPSTSPTAPPRPDNETIRVRELKPHPDGSKVCPTVRVDNGSGAAAQLHAVVESDGWFRSSKSPRTALAPVPELTSRVVQLPCVKRPIGPGRLKVTLDAGDEITPAHLFWLPWPLLISLLLLLLLIGALLSTFLRGLLERRRDEEAVAKTGEEPERETT